MAICATMAGAPFTSCSDSETESPDVTESTDVTEVTKGVLSISASKQSRSVSEARKADYDATEFESGDEIGLYVLSSTDKSSAYSSEYNCCNVRATYNGSSWELDNDIYLSEDDDAYIIAYYPYDSSVSTLPTSNDETLLFDLTPSTDDNEQTDVLVSGGVIVSSDDPAATLSLSHVLTRITLSIKVGEDTDEDDTDDSDTDDSSTTESSTDEEATEDTEDTEVIGTLKSASISADKLYGYIGLYLDDGSFTTYSQTKTDYDLTLSLNETLSTGTDTTVDVDFLISSESSTTLTVALVIDDNTYSFDINIEEDDGWSAGTQYIYNVTVTTEEESSSATSVNGYEAVDLGVSVLWATMNVGASSEEGYGDYYAWGEIDVPSDGIYSTSNCKLCGNTTVEDISGNATYDVARAKWKDPWRMPTKTEVQELIDGCTWTWGAMKDEDGNDVNGYYVTGNDNSIFLPAAGFNYSTSGTATSVNTAGGYWSSTYYTFNSTKAYSTFLQFTSSTKTVYRRYCYYGCSVRAVCDKSEEEEE